MERIWRLRVKESIEYFLQVYKYEKLTLSQNQWSILSKSKMINESLLNRQRQEEEPVEDDVELLDADSAFSTDKDKVKFVGSHCAILSINESTTNVEIDIVGPNMEVDKFIVKIKDVICKAYFTFELEEKIIKFKTYLYECEDLLGKWLSRDTDQLDSDTELSLASGRNKDGSDSLSIAYKRGGGGGGMKLTKSRSNTIDEFLSKLERDHLDMELSYGKLFQELGYTFLSSHASQQDPTDEDDDEYKDFNQKISDSISDMSLNLRRELKGSQMDKIKYTLDDMRVRINEMRRKFRQFVIKSKRQTQRRISDASESNEETVGDENEAESETESDDIIKVCVYVKQQGKIVTFKIHSKCRVGELKQILYEKLANRQENSIEDIVLTYNSLEMSNNAYSITDYGISDKSTITLEIL